MILASLLQQNCNLCGQKMSLCATWSEPLLPIFFELTNDILNFELDDTGTEIKPCRLDISIDEFYNFLSQLVKEVKYLTHPFSFSLPNNCAFELYCSNKINCYHVNFTPTSERQISYYLNFVSKSFHTDEYQCFIYENEVYEFSFSSNKSEIFTTISDLNFENTKYINHLTPEMITISNQQVPQLVNKINNILLLSE